MGAATLFKTPNGEEMIVLSREDYDALLKQAERAEDLEDVLAINEFETRLAAGEEELIPAEFVNRMIDGENPVRVWRDFRGVSGKDLAASAGISAAYLSEIETGKKEGSLSAFKAIAKALRLDLDDLVWDRDETPANDE
ncbi:helix-turn-helix transcriptional regulator [Rhizobium sp. CG5]|uniref:helix-turn-helix domain-containing protein n=1 Tax=Rhizobium sp. CG5 TaxID=2726076 RepID=UPI00203401B3|nr:helix-turn-helix transcriptional regulator [Rhizobium sp. CG5]MCM2473035.1 helix-turn-helix transcriptional regulator [Rhizobium sp. CG5]